jgi:hypothetical protein
MEFRWERRSESTLILLGPLKGQEEILGWVIPKGWDGGSWVEASIAGKLTRDVMPCEEQEYPTLRQAMRALKATVIVLLIGRAYGV